MIGKVRQDFKRQTYTGYTGPHPGNISAHLLEMVADASEKGCIITPQDVAAIKCYAADIERLGRAAGVKFFGD